MTNPNPFDDSPDVQILDPDDLTIDALEFEHEDGAPTEAIVPESSAALALRSPVQEVAEADARLEVLRLDRDRVVSGILADFPEVQELDRKIAAIQAARADAFERIAGLFRDRTVGIKFAVTDALGTLTATWAKPRVTVSSRRNLRDVLEAAEAGDERAKDVADFLGLDWKASKASAPKVNWKPRP